MKLKASASRADEFWSRLDAFARRRTDEWIHSAKLLGSGRSERPCPDRCGHVDHLRPENSPRPVGCGNPNDGAAGIGGLRADLSFRGCVAAVDRFDGIGNDPLCRTRDHSASGTTPFRVVVLRLGYRLYDGRISSGHGLCPADRVTADAMV